VERLDRARRRTGVVRARIESFGPGAVAVRETPSLLGKTDAASLLRDLASTCGMGRGVAAGATSDARRGTMACHGSVRAAEISER